MKFLLGLVLLLSASSVLSVRRVIYRAVPNGEPEPVYLLRQSTSGRIKAEPLDSETNFMNALNLVATQREPETKEDQTKWGFFTNNNQVVTPKPAVNKETIIHHHYISYPLTANGGPSPYPSYPVRPYPRPGYPIPHNHHHVNMPPNYPYPGYPPYHPNGYPRPQPYQNTYSNLPGQPNIWSGWYGAYDKTHDGQHGFSYPEDDDLEAYGRRPRKLATGGSTVLEAVSDLPPTADKPADQ